MWYSSRCKRWVPCHWVEVATLHTCNADGANIRAISANVEQENTPWPMPGGRVLYTRWEYICGSKRPSSAPVFADATDPDYQANQRDAQHTWQRQRPDYWRHYRQRRADYRERNRLLQTHRDQKRRPKLLAKMDASGAVTFVNPGIYHLIPATGEVLAKMDALSVKCRLIPMT